MTGQEKHLTPAESAKRLGVRLDYVYGLLWAGRLEGRKVDGRWQIPAAAVEKRIKEREAAYG